MNKPTEQVSAPERLPDLVVGVGASAGGLSALEQLFSATKPGLGCAFVVLQHLSHEFRSRLDELLARHTPLPVARVENGMRILADRIYVTPPGKEILLSGGCLLLTDLTVTDSTGHLIDHFLRSLANDAGPRGVAIILSGTGSDGTKGLKDVHAAGGSVLVQSPESAEFDGMPRSAFETGLATQTLPPEKMPAALETLVQDARENQTLPTTAANTILERLMEVYGLDFSQYKSTSVQRRIERRIELSQCDSLADYSALLDRSLEELDLLYQDLLIGVTRFFRDTEAFDHLKRYVIPALLQDLSPGEELRVWVAGCATGEEAYSIGMVILEAMAARELRVPARIFATDVHARVLKIASTGIYPESALEGVSPEQRRQFFIERGGQFQVNAELRSMVVFAPHNLLRDAPFTKLDLITCRNLLIYLQPTAQRKALGLFHFGLKQRGVLFLGPSETLGDLSDEFDTLDSRWKLFRKRRDARSQRTFRPPSTSGPFTRTKPSTPAPALPGDPRLQGVYDSLLDQLIPPSFLVNAQRELTHTFAGAGKFLRIRDGRMSGEITDLLDGELRIAVSSAIQRVYGERKPIHIQNVIARSIDGAHALLVRGQPIINQRTGDIFALISLEEQAPSVAPASDGEQLSEASQAQLQALESELRYTKENLQTTIEELVTSNEQLQATNEELVAANEELQTTNQELHSVNEELHTINTEYQRSIGELTDLNIDMDHLMTSTEVHTLFLDKNLQIRRFTARMSEIFNLIPQDIGRGIETFRHCLRRSGLSETFRAVAAGGEPVEEHVQDDQGRWYLLRILPHRRGLLTDGVVVTLIDTTKIRQAEAEASNKQMLLSSILKNLPHQVFITDRAGRYVLANDVFRGLLQADPIRRSAAELFPDDVAQVLTSNDAQVIRTGTTIENEILLPGGEGLRTFLCVKFPLREQDGSISGVGTINTDVTGLKLAELEAHRAVAQRDRFLATLSHELRNPLSAVLNAAMVLERTPSDNPALWRKVILEGAQHMTKILEDLLDVARITQDKLTVERVHINLRDSLRRALDEITPQLQEKKITLSEQLSPDEFPLLGDASRLQQAIGNILSNAVRYTNPEGEISISLQREETSALLRVTDNGIGMKPETLSRVFEPFFQGHAPGSRGRDSGMGIGLALVRRIVGLHDGTISASSPGEGQGSTFELRLPLADAPPVSQSLLPAPPEGLHLLLVEDDAHNRAGLTKLLEMDGLHVIAVGSGEAALELYPSTKPQAILIDIGLPGIDGHETCRRIRQLPGASGVVILAFTGFGQQSDRDATRASGFDAHVVKPIEIDELYVALNHALRAKNVRPGGKA